MGVEGLVQKRFQCPKCRKITLAYIRAGWCEHCLEGCDEMELVGLEEEGKGKCSVCGRAVSYKTCYKHALKYPGHKQPFTLRPISD